MKLLKGIVIMLILMSLVFSQSKTEDAKDKLDDAGDTDDTEETVSDDDNDDDGDDFFGSLIAEIVFEVFIKSTAGLLLNTPMGETYPSQSVYYYDYPYCALNTYGIRTSERISSIRTQTHLTLGKGYNDVFNTYGLTSNIHLAGWAFKLRYKYVDENNSPYTLHYMTGRIERKSRVFNNMDMGISAGVDSIRIDGDDYTGFSLGYNLELFTKYRISLNFNPGLMFYRDEIISDIMTGVNYHLDRYYFGIEYERLNIIGVKFNSLAFRLGLYF